MFKSKIAPSLLSCDFSKLKEEIKAVEKAGADLLHLDVMDGHFVPNLTIGPFIVEAIRRCTALPLDTHLMIQYPDKYIKEFIQAGTNMVSFHVEVSQNPKATIELIHKLKAKAGVALNPDTSISTINPFLPLIDTVLVMSVHPGFAEQTFIESSLEKIIDLKKYRTARKLSFDIEVDGGIKVANIGKTAEAGANIFVAGSGIFKTKNYGETILEMRKEIEHAITHK